MSIAQKHILAFGKKKVQTGWCFTDQDTTQMALGVAKWYVSPIIMVWGMGPPLIVEVYGWDGQSAKV